MSSPLKREAISRARFFQTRAETYTLSQRDDFEADLEAAIVFSRAALARLPKRFARKPGFGLWWQSLRKDASVEFFRKQGDYILKERSARVNQRAFIGPGAAPSSASSYYYFEDGVPALVTLGQHLARTRGDLGGR